MKKTLFLVATLLLTFSYVSAQKITPVDWSSGPEITPEIINSLKGEWENQIHSVLKIDNIDPKTGQISGSYISFSGTDGETNPLIGWINTAQLPADNKEASNVVVVSFSVRWIKWGSVATWNGFYSDKETEPQRDKSGKPIFDKNFKPRILGQWLLSRANSKKIWDHILAGQDIFFKKK